MDKYVSIILVLLCCVPTLIISAVTPYITRRTECFGVSIPEEQQQNEDVKNAKTIYKNNVLLTGGLLTIAMVVATLLLPVETSALLIAPGIITLLAMMYIFYWQGHKKIKQLKKDNKWLPGKTQLVMADTNSTKNKAMVSPMWFLLNIAIIAGTAIIGLLYYDKAPDMIPIHWNAQGIADSYVTKSYMAILWEPIVQCFLTFILAFSYWTIGKAKNVINVNDPENSIKQSMTFRRRWSMMMVAMAVLLNLMMLSFQLVSLNILASRVIMPITLTILAFILIGTVFVSVMTGQGGSRVAIKSSKEGDTKVISRDDDQYWKLGLFYFNPDDPAFILEKRFGVGFTINWARPTAWVIIGGILLATGFFKFVIKLIVK